MASASVPGQRGQLGQLAAPGARALPQPRVHLQHGLDLVVLLGDAEHVLVDRPELGVEPRRLVLHEAVVALRPDLGEGVLGIQDVPRESVQRGPHEAGRLRGGVPGMVAQAGVGHPTDILLSVAMAADEALAQGPARVVSEHNLDFFAGIHQEHALLAILLTRLLNHMSYLEDLAGRNPTLAAILRGAPGPAVRFMESHIYWFSRL
mmetsp:Transcript_98810/g.288234  ORF Transcript_98810/g.288234 Transcript_98810/m.288234 type:complete len:206 (+) Transcript_98810:2531-3148(+)